MGNVFWQTKFWLWNYYKQLYPDQLKIMLSLLFVVTSKFTLSQSCNSERNFQSNFEKLVYF